MRFKTTFFNISEIIRDQQVSQKKELLQVIDELQNGNFTFEYSLASLSKNIQARLKKLHFARKNIFSNVQMFMSYFNTKQFSEQIAEDIILNIMQFLHELVREQFTYIKVFFVIDGKQTPQQSYKQQSQQIGTEVWKKIHKDITKQYAGQIKQQHLHVDQYTPEIHTDYNYILQLVTNKIQELIHIANQQSESPNDVFTKIIKNIQIMNDKSGIVGPAKRYIPYYIQRHYSDTCNNVLVIDPCQDAPMLQLTTGLNQSLYMQGKFMQLDEFRQILNTLYKIPKEQCKALGWLYAASRLDSMPRVSTIAISGSDLSVHCYIYSKYLIKSWNQGFEPKTMHILLQKYFAAYVSVQKMIDNSRINPYLYKHLGGILIYSNKKLSGLPRELRIPRTSIRTHLFNNTTSQYSKSLQSIYMIHDNKNIKQKKIDLSPKDVQQYIRICIQELNCVNAESNLIWIARAPFPYECVSVNTQPISHCIYAQNANQVKCNSDINILSDLIITKQLAFNQTEGMQTIDQLDFCNADVLN